MDADHADGRDIFFELDRAPVPAAYWPDLGYALLNLSASIVPLDRPILSSLNAYLMRNAAQLRALQLQKAKVNRPRLVYESHPATITLLFFTDDRPTGLERLACIGLAALLETGAGTRHNPARVLSIVRGALVGTESPLPGVMSSIRSIPEMVRLIDNDDSVKEALPAYFLTLWDSWLRDRLTAWMHAEPERVHRQLEPRAFVPQIEEPAVQVATRDDRPEEGPSLTGFVAPPSYPHPGETASTRAGKAASDDLDRQSVGDLLVAPEFRIPKAVDERLCRGTIKRAEELIRQDLIAAEPYVALSLLLGGGIREIDLREVVWGTKVDDRVHAMDPALPVLYRRIKRPVNAVAPKPGVRPLLEPSTDVIAWPLPTTVHKLLLSLAGAGPVIGDPVLPNLAGSAGTPYRMRKIVADIVPEAKVGAIAPRLALAARIAAGFGVEVAQLALADTFGMSFIPSYYSALPEHDLATAIAAIQSQRFGEPVATPTGRDEYVGSRLVLTQHAAEEWPRALRRAVTTANRRHDNWLNEWIARRDFLAAALCYATGHRPEDALGTIHLADVIPEYGLIVLQDKQVDALRAARVAATGRLWLSELRAYLDRLLSIADERAGTPEAALATAILQSDEALFSVPTPVGGVAVLTAAVLREGMPTALQPVDNFYRHRLNQQLLARRMDPELRHAQLGWVVSPAHFFSELSPRSPTAMGHTLGPVIDDILTADGWFVQSDRRKRWTWDRVPMPPPIDWRAVLESENRRRQTELRDAAAKLQQRWSELEPEVLARLATAIEEFSPLLRLDTAEKRLRTVEGVKGAVDLTSDQHAFICEKARLGDQHPSSALEAIMARILLYRIVRQARDKGVVRGPIPSRPFLTLTSDPSPFVPGLGTAVRHAFEIRRQLLGRASAGSVRDQGSLVVWSLLAFSMYRRMDFARAATDAAHTATRAGRRGGVIRVAARVNEATLHLVLGGVPAVLIVRRKQRAPTGHAPSIEALEAWAVKHLSETVAWGEPGVAGQTIERTLAAAGQIEMSGVARLLLRMGTQTAAESPTRCIARDDAWPVHTADTEVTEAEDVTTPTSEAEHQGSPPWVGLDAGYREFTALLNKRAFAQRRAANARDESRASDGKRNWRRVLREDLLKLREKWQKNANLCLLIGYSLNHLRYGSEDGRRLTQGSLHREIATWAQSLLVHASGRNLLDLPADETRRLYREVLLSKSVAARPYTFEEIRRFQRFMVRVHSRPSIDMAELGAFAGERVLGVKPGLLTPAERTVVCEELDRDYTSEQARTDANPDLLRVAGVRQIYYLVLEASGIRPESAYGLTLADIHFTEDGVDVLHVRRTGEFGEAKTGTSVGFVPLDGALWRSRRSWVRKWIDAERDGFPTQWGDRPLFAKGAGSRWRFPEDQLARRINALVKWVAANRSASVYWLRKTRISERFHALSQRRSPTACSVYAAMILSGHAGLQVTVESYINDPAAVLFEILSSAGTTSRAALLAMSGVDSGAIDMIWSRNGDVDKSRVQLLLDRMGETYAPIDAEHRTVAPALSRPKSLLPLHVHRYACAMHERLARDEAAFIAGITRDQAMRLNTAAEKLLLARGEIPWRLSAEQAPRSVLPVPRRLGGAEKAFDLLNREPTAALAAIATRWAGEPHIARRFGHGVMMSLGERDVPAMQAFLDSTGIDMAIESRDGHYLLNASQVVQHRKSHRSLLRWLLAIFWIHAELVARV